jgi:hypothetical protein
MCRFLRSCWSWRGKLVDWAVFKGADMRDGRPGVGKDLNGAEAKARCSVPERCRLSKIAIACRGCLRGRGASHRVSGHRRGNRDAIAVARSRLGLGVIEVGNAFT